MADDAKNEIDLKETYSPFKVVDVTYGDVTVKFAIKHVHDVVQRHISRGRFYEEPELDLMAQYIPPNANILDIGTNVGNHAIWFAAVMKARKVWVFEPNPIITDVIHANIELNNLEDVIVSDFIGIGLSDTYSDSLIIHHHDRNIGGGRMHDRDGDLVVRPGDDLGIEDKIDFMKIDVECMEVQVLNGLEKTITRDRPVIFIEVDVTTQEAFLAWCETHNYSVEKVSSYANRNANYLCMPR